MKNLYEKKLCWDAEGRSTRIRITVEIEGGHFSVVRKSLRHTWGNGTPTVEGILPVMMAEFPTEEAAKAFAEKVVSDYIAHEQFKECPDEHDHEFGV